MAVSRKVKFIEKVLHDVSLVILSYKSLDDSIETFLDRGYATGGDDPITNTDLEPYETDYDEFTDVKKFVDNFKLFLENGTPAQDDYRSILNNLRDDK